MLSKFMMFLDSVGLEANARKMQLGMLNGIPEDKMHSYLSDADFREADDKISKLGLFWYRKRKNQDIKDKFTLEGLNLGYLVRAEKTMGAHPEFCKKDDQMDEHYNRFDLCWQPKDTPTEHDNRKFILAMEIEMQMDPEHKEILRDFKKLVKNNKTQYKVMVCQAKTLSDFDDIKAECLGHMSRVAHSGGEYLLSSWVWEYGKFVHHRL